MVGVPFSHVILFFNTGESGVVRDHSRLLDDRYRTPEPPRHPAATARQGHQRPAPVPASDVGRSRRAVVGGGGKQWRQRLEPHGRQ